MPRPSSAASRDWLNRVSLLGGGLLVLVCVIVLAGREPWIDALLNLHAEDAAMRLDAALGFCLLGVALLALECNAGRLVWLALVPAGIGCATLLQSVGGRNLHMDEWLAPLHAAPESAPPDQMPVLVAVALLTAGVCVLLFKCPRMTRWCGLFVVLGASLIISIGLSPLLGRILGLSVGSVLHPVLRPGPLVALCCVLFGILLLCCVWRRDPDREVGIPSWLPVPVLAVGTTVTLLFTTALRDREAGFVQSTTELAINNVATILNIELEGEVQALQRMAARWTRAGSVADALREQDGAIYRENFPALRSLTWIDESGRSLWVYPVAGNEYLLDFDHRTDPVRWRLIQQARQTGLPSFSGLTPLPLGGQGFFTCVPLLESDGSCQHVLLGKFSYAMVMQIVQKRLHMPSLYAIAIDVDGQRIFEEFPESPVLQKLSRESVFSLFNQRINITLSPSEAALKQGRRYFPELFAVLGLWLTLGLGAAAHLVRTGGMRRRAAERANALLQAENEERRHAETALRASQAATRKLSLVASSTDNLVIITDAAGRIEWVNESVVRLFDLSLAELAGRELASLLVGPDTDPSTALRLRDALNRAVSFNSGFNCQTRDGLRCDLHLDLQPVRNEAGVVENFIGILVDITSLVETEKNLRRAKEEADAASRAKSEFLASMSHEIRTPMNGVIGMTSLLLETALTSDQRECVNTIRTSGDSLLSIINDILDFSKIESGRLDLEQHPLDLSACLEETLDVFAIQAAKKHVDLAYFIDPGVPAWILGDATRLRQIVANLLNNAVKFTPNGFVSVEASRTDAPGPGAPAATADTFWLVITVRDTGIGIPEHKHHLLFKPFSQVDSSTTRKYGGTGLGLAISRRLCELMGGTIIMESRAGKGSSFTVKLPVQPVAQPVTTLDTTPHPLQGRIVWVVDSHDVNRRFLSSALGAIGLSCVAMESAHAARMNAQNGEPPALLIVAQLLPDGEGRLLAGELRSVLKLPQLPLVLLMPAGESTPRAWLQELAPATSLPKPLKTAPLLLGIRSLVSPPVPRHSAAAGGGRLLSDEIPLKILLVEDNPVNRNVALSLLARLGYKADSVVNGVEAVSAFSEQSYDLVMMDLQMPMMDGLEATRELRRRLAPDRQPRIIAVTANAVVGDRELCLAAGMDDYVTKPLKLDGISAAIRRNCAKKQAE